MAQHAPRAPLCLLVPWLRIASLLLRLAVPAAAAPVPAGDSIDPAKLAMHTRQRLSDWCGSASFFVWLFAQTPQIYTNYHRKSVDGLSGVFVAQWMLGDVLNLWVPSILRLGWIHPADTFLLSALARSLLTSSLSKLPWQYTSAALTYASWFSSSTTR